MSDSFGWRLLPGNGEEAIAGGGDYLHAPMIRPRTFAYVSNDMRISPAIASSVGSTGLLAMALFMD
jgi:hypothetical protein